MPRPVSSLWRLLLMLLALIGAALLLMWLVSSWALHRTLHEAGRAVVLDDLGEYGALYEREGLAGVRDLFASGVHETDQRVRLVGADGGVLLDMPLPGHLGAGWPELPKLRPDVPGAVAWHRHPLPGGGATLTIGRRRLADGTELWFGRTDTADQAAIARMHRLITLAMGAIAVLALGPVVWFSHRVLQPMRRLIRNAQRLVCDDATIRRLETTGAIAELEEFADAFNRSLGRVQALTDELEAANDQLAHELRTPLARIRGNVESVLTVVSPAAREAAERAITEVDRAARLVQTILSIRAGDAGALKLQAEELALDRLVAETCELYAAAAEDGGLRLEFDVAGVPCLVTADRQRVQQALCNLLDNAVAYTPRGGRIRVETEFTAAAAVIRVQDSGPGLSSEDQGRIWRRFVRGSAASGHTGIGLGLCLVQAVARAHHGKAGARNRPEGGAEFWLRLPYSWPGCRPDRDDVGPAG